MAKKRLNKKVALIGFVFFMIFMLGATAMILYLSRNPEKYIKDGDAALLVKDYDKAVHCYLKARSLSKDDAVKIKMLFKLVDVYIETDKWRNVLGCWNEIIRLDPENVKSRYGRLRYFYTMADSGVASFWQDINEQASQFIELVETKNLLDEDTNAWETVGLPKSTIDTSRMGPYLYIVRGRALLEKARQGSVTDPDELLAQSISDLEKVLQLEPDNIDTYWYLAQAYIARGELYAARGDIESKGKDLKLAQETLEKPVKAEPENLQAHINLLAMKPIIAQMTDREQLASLEPEYLELAKKFDSDAKMHSTLAAFYTNLGYKSFDKAVAQIDKAIELDSENVEYAVKAAGLYYRKASVFNDKALLDKAVKIAKNAMSLPDAQETKGPQQWTNKRNRIGLNNFLAYCYIGQIINPAESMTDEQKKELLAEAEKTVHEIGQLYGSGEELVVVKWQGMLEFARGNKEVAVRKLVQTYDQLKAAGQRDTQLAYTLAKLFENSEEIGAAAGFFGTALSINDRSVADKIDDSRPEAFLDYSTLAIKLRAYDFVVNIINYFEKEYWTSTRSRAIRIEALIGLKQFDEAEQELAKENPETPATIKLQLLLARTKASQTRAAIMRRQMEQSSDIWKQMKENDDANTGVSEAQVRSESDKSDSLNAMADELNGYMDAVGLLTGKLLAAEPNAVADSLIGQACDNYIANGKTDQANILVDKYLEHFPNNTNILVYKKILAEPDPNSVSPEKRNQLEFVVLSNIPDPAARAMYLGAYFQRNNEPNKVIEEYKKILDMTPQKENAGTKDNNEIRRMAADVLAEVALRTNDVALAEKVANVGRQDNLDGCEGKFFAALVALIKDDYKAALDAVDECLKMRPIFSYAYMLRSNINSLLGNELVSVADIQKAASMNPLDGAIAKMQASVLYLRNQKLGYNATSEQIQEAQETLDKAMALNPNDTQLLGFYAEYISDKEPIRAIAIKQVVLKSAPNMENAFSLGQMALKLAGEQSNPPRKEAFYAVALSALQQAITYDAKNQAVLNALAEYYRATGQEKKAEELLMQSQDSKLLWRHFVMSEQHDKAKKLLLELYAKEPNDGDTLRGLLFVARVMNDREGVIKYSDELIAADDSPDTRFLQVQTFLQGGLINEGESKLASFKEKYPNDTRGLQLEGWLAMRQGKLEVALELINKNLELNQDDAAAWKLRGEINYLMTNYDQAVADFRKSKAIADEPATRIALAKAQLRIGRGEDAITELEALLDNPKAPVEGALLLEDLFQRFNKKKSLVNLYKKVLENFPDNLLWYDRAGRFALDVNDFDSATILYETGWRKSNGRSRNLLDGYLQSLLGAGEIDKAIEEASKYVDSPLAPVALYRIGEAKLKLGNKAEAIQFCRRAVEKAADNENAATWVLEKMYGLLGPDEVLKVCKGRLLDSPNSPAANFAMFNIMKLNGEYNKAVEYIDKCVSYVADDDSESETELKILKVEALQLAYVKTSDNSYLHDAISVYESLLVKMPNNISILNNLAYMFAEADEQLDKALDYAKKAHDVAPNDAGFMDTYAYLLYKNGEYPRAAELGNAAIQQYEQEKKPVPYDVYEHLAKTREALGQTNEARTAYEQALEAGGNMLSKAVKERIEASIKQLSQ